MSRRAVAIALGLVLAVSGCVAYIGMKGSLVVTITNDGTESIVLQIDAPRDPLGLWPRGAAFLIGPGGHGPYLEADAGSAVRIFTASCDAIAVIHLPTWALGDPYYTFNSDGTVTSHQGLQLGDRYSDRMTDHEPCA